MVEPGNTGRRWAAVLRLGLLSAALLSILLLSCCPRQRVVINPARRFPQPEHIVLPVPSAVYNASDTVTEASMRNVLFHVDDDLRFGIRQLRGRMRAVRGERAIVLDDKERLMLEIAHSELGLTSAALSLLLNRYIFGYPGSPLKDLVVRTEGDHLVQTGVMHKIIDIPFQMTAQPSVTPTGWIRIHPTRMEICNLNGQKLLKAVGRTLEDLLDVSGAKGVRVEGNDLLIDPLASLPPPKLAGRLTGLRVEGDELVQVFGSPDAPGTEPLPPPVAAENYIYFRGGTIRFGKLYMVVADLLTIDGDQTDPFDFYLDYYHSQLVAGYHVTLPNYALVTWMPDFDDLGTPAGELVRAPAAPLEPAHPTRAPGR